MNDMQAAPRAAAERTASGVDRFPRRAAAAVAAHPARARRCCAIRARRCDADDLCRRALRPFRHADPRAGLPRSRAAVAVCHCREAADQAPQRRRRVVAPAARVRPASASDALGNAEPARRMRFAPIPRPTCAWCRFRSSSGARPTANPAGSACCSRKTGSSSAASGACSRCCSTAATRSCSSRRRCRCARRSATRPNPSAACASCSASCACISAASARSSSGPIFRTGAPSSMRCSTPIRCAPRSKRPRARKTSAVEAARERARKYAMEIAADYSHPVVRSISFMLKAFWNKLYDGVDVHHFDTVREVAPGHEVIYVPCHRSHVDYLLLSYQLLTNRRGDSAHRRRRQSQPAGDRPDPAPRQRVLPAPHVQGRPALFDRVPRIHRAALRARRLARILHRRRPFAHRAPAQPTRRHAVDDAAQLPARIAPAGRVPAGLHRLREDHGRRRLYRRAFRQAEGKGIAARFLQGVRRAAPALRPRRAEFRRADFPAAAAR